MTILDPVAPPFDIPVGLSVDDLLAVLERPVVTNSRLVDDDIRRGQALAVLEGALGAFLDEDLDVEAPELLQSYATATAIQLSDESFAWLLGLKSERDT